MVTQRDKPSEHESPEELERQLVDRLRSDDKAAFEELVRTYGPRMLLAIRRFLSHEQDAQDALQDAFLSAFKAIDRFHGDSQLGTWLHRIAVNAALMKLRSRRRRPERSIDDLLPRFHGDGHMTADSNQDWAVTMDSAVRDRETQEVVRRQIDQLPDSYRSVLLLRDIEGQSTDEAAAMLGISSGAVKTRLHRARQALRTLLDPHMREAQS